MPEPAFEYTDMLPTGEDGTRYRLLTTEGVRTVEGPDGRTFLEVSGEALRLLADEAMHDIAHYLRPAHLAQLRRIVDDPEASANDKFVALDLLKNANIAAAGVLPMCQDTGTAIVMGKRGGQVLRPLDDPYGTDEEALSRGVFDAYTRLNLRYSQLAPLTMWEERNTGSNLPAQLELYADTKPGHEARYELLFMAKGGGSANKSFLYQETKAVLNPQRMMTFLDEKLRSLGTSACPPYHLAIVVGGTSAEFALKTAKYASAKYLDTLPTAGLAVRARVPRPRPRAARCCELTRNLGIGAQFGGKYFCHDVRVVRLPRHGASCPVAIAVSCSADRQARARDHRRGRVPRGARARPRAVPARHHRRAPRRRRRRRRPDRPQPPDGRDPRRARRGTPSGPGCRCPARSSSPATSRTRRSRSGWTPASRCRSTSRTTPSTTPVRPRRPRATRPGRSARPPPAGWTPTSTSSRPRAARW